MEVNDVINIAEDFSRKLGARYKYEGKWSGEEFLEKLLLPRFDKAVENNYILKIILDGVLGYPSSFVSGSFGKLSIEKGTELVLKHSELESSSILRKEKILNEIKQPRKK